MHTDAKDLVDNVESLRVKAGFSKRRRIDIADMKELRSQGLLRRLLHVMGDFIHSDPLTKQRTRTRQTMERLVELLRTGYYEPICS